MAEEGTRKDAEVADLTKDAEFIHSVSEFHSSSKSKVRNYTWVSRPCRRLLRVWP